MKKFKSLLLVLFSLCTMFLFKGIVFAATTYKLYEDSNGVRWQYAYIEDTDRVEISFFDNRNNRESVTIPSLSTLRDSDVSIPSSVKVLQVEDYANHNLETPSTQTNNITTVNLSNATVINGVSPMINSDEETTITFSSSVGTIIGNEAFTGYNLAINNLDKVTSIGDKAFKNATLTYKNLALNSLETIGDSAFMGTNIEKITNINTERIEYNAFRDCTELVSVKLGNNVKDIGAAAFQNDQKLTTINYNNVTKIGNFAFADCIAYNVDISNTKLTEIGDAAYSNTPGFTKSIKIPDGVTFLGWRVFYKSGITGVDLNNVEFMNVRKDRDYNNVANYSYNSKTGATVTDEGEGETFAYCENLSDIKFGKVWYISYAAFYGNKSLTEVNFSDSVLMVNTLAFADCNIEKLNLNKVQRIETASFANNKLTELYLPKSLNYLQGYGTFNDNPIKKVTIAYDMMSSNISNLLIDLFRGGPRVQYGDYKYNSWWDFCIKTKNSSCEENIANTLKDIIIEAPYKDNEEPVIDSVFGSKHLPYSEVVKKYPQSGDVGEFHNTSTTDKYKEDILANPDQYKNIVRPGYFLSLKGMENITIKEGYEFIGQAAFFTIGSGFNYFSESINKPDNSLILERNVSKVSLPESLKGIGRNAFMELFFSEVEINLPKGLEYIGDQAFFWDIGFTEDLDLPNLRYLGVNAFAMSGIGNIYLHDKLEHIGVHAFFTTPQSYGYPTNINPSRFHTKEIVFDVDIYGIETIGTATSDSYKCAQHFVHTSNQYPWVDSYVEKNEISEYDLIKFTDKVVTEPCGGFSLNADYLPSSGVSYPAAAFFFGLRAKKIDLGETGWKNVGYGMFNSVLAEEVILPKNLEKIEATAFQGARIKKEIEIPDTVKFIGTSAFDNNMSAIWSFANKYWKKVGEEEEDYRLKIKNLPKSLEYIGDGAFYASLFPNGIVIPAGVTRIGFSAFAFGVYGDNNRTSEISSVTIECNLPSTIIKRATSVYPISTISDLFYHNKIKKMVFGENVTEIPANGDALKTMEKSEFYGLDVEEVEFANLKVLPQKAFIDDTNLKKVTFKNGLEEIGDFAFYNTSVEQVDLPDNNETIKIGYSAFRKTNLESLGNDESSFNTLKNNIVTTGPYAFADNSSLKTVIIPDGFNNNTVAEYTFKNCDNLNKVDVYRNIETINSEAFNGDYNFKKLFLWGDTKIEQNNVDAITEAGNIKVINTSAYYREKYEENPKATLEFKINNSASGQTKLNKTQIDFGYTYEYNGTGTITFEHPEEVTVNLVKTSDGYIANIQDVKETVDYGDFTVPAATDLYSYSTYDVKNWETDNGEYRRSEELGTDAKFYDLDEVLYLTSNHPKVKLTDNKKDFDKTDLIVYALRRDGVIMESDKWGEYTKHFARSSADINFEKYDSDTEEDAKMVYDIPYPVEEVDVSTENFKSMTYEIVNTKGLLPKKEIELYYTNSMIDTTVDTTIEIENVVDKVVDAIVETVNTGSGRVISTIIFLILSFLGLRFIIIKRKKKLVKI